MLDPYQIVFICAIPLILVMSFFLWLDRREKEERLEERIKQLEEKLKEKEE